MSGRPRGEFLSLGYNLWQNMKASCHPVVHMDNDGRSAQGSRRSLAFTQQLDLELLPNFSVPCSWKASSPPPLCVLLSPLSHSHLSKASQGCFQLPSSETSSNHFIWLLKYYFMWCYNQLEQTSFVPLQATSWYCYWIWKRAIMLPGFQVLWFFSHRVTSRSKLQFSEGSTQSYKNYQVSC